MQRPAHDTALARFRAALYATVLGKRKDSLCDLLDAVLTAAIDPISGSVPHRSYLCQIRPVE